MPIRLFKKRARVDLIEAKAQKIAANLVNDVHNFTATEQASIIKRVNNIFIQRFSDSYAEAYRSQQAILEAKEIIK